MARSLAGGQLVPLMRRRFRQQLEIVLIRDPVIDGNVPGRPAPLRLCRCVGLAVVDEIADNVKIGLAAGPVERRPGVHVLSLDERQYVFVRVVASVQVH